MSDEGTIFGADTDDALEAHEEFDFSDDDELDGGIVPDDYDDDVEDDDEDFDDEDDYEDATEDDIDFAVALYLEDGTPTATRLATPVANDLDELMEQLRRLPGEAGALGLISIAGEFFMMCRVRGRTINVLLSDDGAAHDWPIARDVIDYLGVEMPEEDDDPEPVGDFAILADLGVSEFEMEQIAADPDEDSDILAERVIEAIGYQAPFARLMR